MSDLPISRLLIAGAGLMGGSLGLALKKNGFASHIVGWSRREQSLQRAQTCGAIDSYETSLHKAVQAVDCVVIATPTQLTEKILIDVVRLVDSSVAVTDVASVKGNLAQALEQEFNVVPDNVVLGHPICGSEKSGVDYATADLYQQQNVVLIQKDSNSQAFSLVESMWQSVGANILPMHVEEHDRVLALTSHLPHMLAYAFMNQLIDANNSSDVFSLSGGGFRDFTRIAASDAVMWSEIVLANKVQLLAAIDDFGVHLEQLKQALEREDAEQLKALFTTARRAREGLDEKK